MRDGRQSQEAASNEASLAYGALATRVVRSVVLSRIRAALPNRFQFCEVATRPATWSFQLLEEFPDARGVVVCASDDCAQKAAARTIVTGYQERLQIVGTRLPDVTKLRRGAFDLSLTLDDTLDAAEEPGWLVSQLTRITKPGRLVMILVKSLCDAVSASLADAYIEQAEQALTGKGCCVPNATDLNLFTSESIEQLLRTAGACPQATLGVPVAVPPWPSEPHEHRLTSVCRMLSNGDSLERILRIEQALLDQRGGAARGSHLLSIAVVPSGGASWGDYWLPEIGEGRPSG